MADSNVNRGYVHSVIFMSETFLKLSLIGFLIFSLGKLDLCQNFVDAQKNREGDLRKQLGTWDIFTDPSISAHQILSISPSEK